MSLQDERLKYLLEQFTSGKATPLEEDELMDRVQGAEVDTALRSYIEELWGRYQPGSYLQAGRAE